MTIILFVGGDSCEETPLMGEPPPLKQQSLVTSTNVKIVFATSLVFKALCTYSRAPRLRQLSRRPCGPCGRACRRWPQGPQGRLGLRHFNCRQLSDTLRYSPIHSRKLSDPSTLTLRHPSIHPTEVSQPETALRSRCGRERSERPQR